MTDQPILKTPGELLAEAREAAGRSLADVAEHTKIPVPQLQAIERDEYHRLSDPLYVKSFLRSYADAVGVDTGTVLDLYARSTGEGARTAGGGTAEVWEQETVTISRVGVDWGRLLGWGVGGALAVLAVWFGVGLLGGGDEPAPGAERPAAAITRPQPAATAPDSAAVATADPDGAGDETGGTTPAAEAAPQQEPAATPPPPRPEPEPETRTPPPSAAATLPPALDTANAVPFAGGGEWPVRIRLLTGAPLVAEARCDGERRFRAARFGAAGAGAPALPPRDIEPGRAYAVREGLVVYWAARDHCGLRLDRTDGVEVTVNGRPRDLGSLRPGQEIILDTHR